MSRHVGSPRGVSRIDPRAYEPLPPYHFPFNVSMQLQPRVHPHLDSTESIGSHCSNPSPNEESPSHKSDANNRQSRGRRFKEALRTRAASLKSDLSFGKKTNPKTPPASAPASRRPSKPHNGQITIPRLAGDPRKASTSSGSSFIWTSTFSTPLTSPESSPTVLLPTMARGQTATPLDPAAVQRRRTITESKARTHRMAVEEERALRQRMKRNGAGDLFPNYKFMDFIGKGTYGRVYQAWDHAREREVAIKLMNLDDVDYLANATEKDGALEEVRQEVKVLMQLKDHGVQNVNLVHDVLEVDGLLWLVCEYCPGGSLKTLLHASNNKCEEKYIRVVARELAIALQSIHNANVIHRDLKAANVMIHERGGLQVIDFGVAGVLESKVDKRGTIIGTPNWMPPEQHRTIANRTELKYGFEVDVWSYICTIFEIATGNPPHAKMPANRLATALRTRPPRLSEEEYPKELCDFVEFVAQANPTDRPSIEAIMDHSYIRDTVTTYPTSMLRDLVERFMTWSFGGGQRHSLFAPHGAQAASEFARNNSDADVDFVFSTSRDFLAEYDPSYDEEKSPDLSIDPFSPTHSPSGSLASNMNDFAIDPSDGLTSKPTDYDSHQSFDHAIPGMDRRIERGAQALGAIFNESEEPYQYGVRSGNMPLDKPILSRAKSDLPLRNANDQSDLATKEVDFNDFAAPTSGVELADADTIKQRRKQMPKEKRETMGWQPDWGDIEANMNMEPDISPNPPSGHTVPAPISAFPIARPALVHSETAPDRVTQLRASTATINLDDMMGDDDWMSGSAMGRFSGFATPAEGEDVTIRHNITDLNEDSFDPLSYASSSADTSASEEDPLSTAVHMPSNYHMNGIHRRRKSGDHRLNVQEDIAPPHPAALRDDADPEIIEAEINRLLGGLMGELGALQVEFPREKDIKGGNDDESSQDGDGEESDVHSGIEA